MSFLRRKDENILEGPLLRKVVFFVLPLMFTNLLQVLYSAADMVCVGFSNVDGALGSIGTTGAMINMIINIFMGFSVGTNVVVARNIGKGDRNATEASVHTSLLMGLIFGLICCVLGIFISRPVLALLGDQGHILDLASLYTRIYFIGVPFISLTNYLIAIFRAKGDTITPLIILSASGLVNVGLNCLFIFAFKMSVDGVAYATVISNIISMTALGISLHRDEGWCRFSFKKLRLDKKAFKEIIKDGLPAGIQGALFSLSNMIIQSSIITVNNLSCPGGSAVIDGTTAAGNLEGFAYTATNSVYQAAVTFTSQHYGAEKYTRIKSVMKCCYLVTSLIAIFCGAIIIIFRHPLISIYSVTDPIGIESATTRILIMMTPYVTLGCMEVGSGVLRGLRRSFLSTFISLMSICVFRVLWIYLVFPSNMTLAAIFISYPISWILAGVFNLLFSLITLRKLIKNKPA